MSPRTIFRLTMDFLSVLSLPIGLTFDEKIDKSWSEAFDLCLLDGPVNVLHRVLPIHFENLIRESQRALEQWNHKYLDPFGPLFLEPLSFHLKYLKFQNKTLPLTSISFSGKGEGESCLKFSKKSQGRSFRPRDRYPVCIDELQKIPKIYGPRTCSNVTTSYPKTKFDAPEHVSNII